MAETFRFGNSLTPVTCHAWNSDRTRKYHFQLVINYFLLDQIPVVHDMLNVMPDMSNVIYNLDRELKLFNSIRDNSISTAWINGAGLKLVAI